jgi:hypothetical protein
MANDIDLNQHDPADTYWAAADYNTEEGREQLAGSIYARVRRYYESLPNTYFYQTITKALNVFHSLPGWYNPFAATVLGRGGSQGQNVSARVNLTGSMARSVIALLLQYLPEPDPSPVNTDVATLEQVSLVKQFMDKYVDEAGVKQGFADVTKLAEINGISFLHTFWNPYEGPYKMEPVTQPVNNPMTGAPDPSLPPQPVMGPDGKPQMKKVMAEHKDDSGQVISARPVRSGQLESRAYSPLDIPFDLSRRDDKFEWLMVPWDINRYDLIALFPEAKEEIMAHTARDEALDLDANINRLEAEKKSERMEDRDALRLWRCYHKPNAAVPDGLQCAILGDSLLFTPGPLAYSRIPVVTFRHGRIDRTPFGDSLFHQVLGLQDTYDDICSSIITNLTAFSKQLIKIPRTADYSIAELTDGLAVIEFDDTDGTGKGGPEGIQLVKIAPEAFRFVEETLPKVAQDIVGLNQATRGSPPPSWSGTLNEQVKAMALSYQNEAHNDLLRGCKETYNLMLEILQNFVTEPIVTELAGSDGVKKVTAFTADQFKQTRRVDIKLGAAFLKDQEAKLDAARELGRLGLVDAGEFLEVMESGSLESTTEDDLAVQRYIQSEDEGLASGQGNPVTVQDSDRDDLHMASHIKRKATLDMNDPGYPMAVQRIDQHNAQHLMSWQKKTMMAPALLMVLKQPPYPAPPPPPGMMPPGGAPPNGPPQGGPPAGPPAHPGSRPPPGQAPGPVTPSGQPRSPDDESTK